MNNSLKSHLALFTANLIYAANFTIAKEVMPHYIQPYGLVLLRVIGALLLFFLVSRLFIKENIEKKDFLRLLFLGLFGVAINQLLFLKGLSISAPINSSIMMITTPVLVLILSAFMLKEKITSIRLAGIIAGFTGAVLLLLLKDNYSFGSETIEGDFYVFLNAASWATYLILVKPLMQKYKTITIVKWVFLFGLIYVFPFGYNELAIVSWRSMPPNIWMYVVFIVIATTFLAYLFNTYALKTLSPSIVSAYIYLQPLLASLIALSFGKDKLTWIKVLAAVLIFAGVYLASRKNKENSD